MGTLLIIGIALLAVALVIRERQTDTQRLTIIKNLENLKKAQRQTTGKLRKTREELLLLRAALRHDGIVSDEQLVKAYTRLVAQKQEKDRRNAEIAAHGDAGVEDYQSEDLATHLNSGKSTLVLEGDEIIH